MTDHFMRYALVVVMKDQMAKMVVKVFYKHFIAVFRVPTKLLSNRGANFTSTLVKDLCSAFGIQKCRTTAYHAQCNGQVEHFHQTLFCMQAITQQEDSVGATPARAPAGLQQHPVGGDRLFAALPDVWEVSLPPCQLLFPDGECLRVLPSCASICDGG